MILARTLKGQGVSFLAGQPDWHGKALKKGDELTRALAELDAQLVPEPAGSSAEIRRPSGPASHAGHAEPPWRRPPTRSATWWPRAKPTAPRSPSSATPIRAWSRSTPT